jgi:SAM-dependent methyltransferase
MIDERTLDHMTRNEADMAFKRRVRTIFEWLAPADNDVILDAGCGRGFYLKMFRHVSRCRLVGLELESGIIRKAKRNVAGLPDAALVNASLCHIPFPDASFDKAILSEILEHLEDDVAGLREVRRVLKPGGVVAITVPNQNYPFWWDPINKTMEALTGRHISRGPLAGIWAGHVRLYSRTGLRRAVTAADLRIEEERAFTHYCFPFIHNIVYGLGKPLLESGLLPKGMAAAADRAAFDRPNRASRLNPVKVGLAVFNLFDRRNSMNEPEGRSTVNLCVKARKPKMKAVEVL